MAETTTETDPAQDKLRGTRDLVTIVAISVVASVISNILHEGVGHGGACVLTGGRPMVLSSVHFECSQDNRWVAAGGTLVNFMAGFLFWLGLRFANSPRAHLRFFLWLLMTINLLQATGYFLFSGMANVGDWAYVIQGLAPAWLWHLLLAIVGAVSYLASVWLALRELRPFLEEQDWRRGGAIDLTLIPYLTSGILHTIAALFNPVGMALVLMSAIPASFGGTSGMAWMTQCLGSKFAPKISCQPVTLQRSPAWIVAAFITATIFVGVIARGIRLA